MLYIRKISEDGWFGKDELDSDSVSELGTSGHDLSVWEVTISNGSSNLDDVALALAMTRSNVEEMYIVFLDTSEIKSKYQWAVGLNPGDGDTRYSHMKGAHTNFVLCSFWEQGYLAEHIHKLIGDSKNYRYYNPNDLKKMAYLAAKSGNLKPEELTKHWKAAIREMGEIYGRINGF